MHTKYDPPRTRKGCPSSRRRRDCRNRRRLAFQNNRASLCRETHLPVFPPASPVPGPHSPKPPMLLPVPDGVADPCSLPLAEKFRRIADRKAPHRPRNHRTACISFLQFPDQGRNKPPYPIGWEEPLRSHQRRYAGVARTPPSRLHVRDSGRPYR